MSWLKQRQQARFDDALAGMMADEAAIEDKAFEARRMALATCLQKLSAEQRELVMRRYEPGASVNGIAAEGKTTPKAISDRLRRIRHALLLCIQRAIAQEAFT